MADQTTGGTNSGNQLLLLNDGQGGDFYAIPRNVLEQHRVTGEQQQQLEKALGEDVSGFRFNVDRSSVNTLSADRAAAAAAAAASASVMSTASMMQGVFVDASIFHVGTNH